MFSYSNNNFSFNSYTLMPFYDGVRNRSTHKKNVSLYVGDQLLFLDFVASFLRLLAKFGPTTLTSTNGRNIPAKRRNSASVKTVCLSLPVE